MTYIANPDVDRPFRRFLSKAPEVTVFFWIIKILATTVGETFADFLNVTAGLGLTLTTVVMSVLLAIVLVLQFRTVRYVPARYWLVVVLISIVGTLITDNLVDNIGVPLEVTTVVFAVLLGATFAVWYAAEKTLSIHTIDTPRREAFYWLAILFTFALGTAAGDLAAEALGLGYAVAAAIFAALIAAVWLAHRFIGLGAVVAFWIAYVLTRPLGASLGDLLAQPGDEGGLGFGTVVTSFVFLLTILAVVAYLSVSKRDQPALDAQAQRVRTRSW
ncbi:COG4705 family protein [Micromonospora sp. CA-244673]|uniref:COG4705 family protein n=1 Tax=Micromonospora sp. CA-244673 TaxID=3239958 RepID=UPI003D929CAE